MISETIQENSRIYRIERKLDAVFQIMNITAIIKDSIRYLDVEEDISTSELLFYSHKFRRYQPEPQYEIKEEASTMHSSSSYLFKADSGLTKYRYYHPPNHIVEETLILDSVSITP
ncbi:MAG TPA: hypothetical protein VHO46_14080 [Bacteroidales bacterium]|nr:hypothetical protein [Bacteroidales bacterium]